MTLYNYVIVGGGIAGVSCAEMLSNLAPDENVLLLTASTLIKKITNYKKVTKTLEQFDVEEQHMSSMENSSSNISVKHTAVTRMDSVSHKLFTSDDQEIEYKHLCICTGGKPKLIAKDNPFVLGIRDTQSVKDFQKQLAGAHRILVVGNGGIATELVYEVEDCEVIWVIKDKSISSTFVDPGAAEFFLPELEKEKEYEDTPSKRLKYTIEQESKSLPPEIAGGALGPDWSSNLKMSGMKRITHKVHVEKSVEVSNIFTSEHFIKTGKQQSHLAHMCDSENRDWSVYVELTNGKMYGCDFVVSATGVVPNTDLVMTDSQKVDLAEDGGMKVNSKMETSIKGVYAAGDVCTSSWEPSQHWLQMRLWTQARQMGAYSAQCMVAASKGQDISLDFCFEMFAHVTKFFNYKVILLGKFNAQGLGGDHELLLRVTKDKEFVKVVLHDGRMHGALLIGETDLEETFENLILNQIDLTVFKDELLNPNIDIDDFFD